MITRNAVDREHPPELARIWHTALAVVVAASLLLQLVLTVIGGADDPGPDGTRVGLASRLLRLFSYFTIQSNLLILIALITLALYPSRDGRLWRILRLDALLGIVITGLVFALVLSEKVHPVGLAAVANAGLHYVAPWAGLLGWLLFGPRPRLDALTIASAFVWPVAWIVYTFIHGALSHWYPYQFLDAGQLGFAIALRNTMFVVVVAAILIVVLKLLDRLPVVGSRRPQDKLEA